MLLPLLLLQSRQCALAVAAPRGQAGVLRGSSSWQQLRRCTASLHWKQRGRPLGVPLLQHCRQARAAQAPTRARAAAAEAGTAASIASQRLHAGCPAQRRLGGRRCCCVGAVTGQALRQAQRALQQRLCTAGEWGRGVTACLPARGADLMRYWAGRWHRAARMQPARPAACEIALPRQPAQHPPAGLPPGTAPNVRVGPRHAPWSAARLAGRTAARAARPPAAPSAGQTRRR